MKKPCRLDQSMLLQLICHVRLIIQHFVAIFTFFEPYEELDAYVESSFLLF